MRAIGVPLLTLLALQSLAAPDTSVSSKEVAQPFRIDTAPLPDDAEANGLPKIIDGETADQRDYPTIFLAKSNAGFCTWFLVGPKVLLSAAHCLGGARGEKIVAKIRIRPPGSPTTFETEDCSTADEYPADRSQDWAACRFESAVPVPVGRNVTGYEVISKQAVARRTAVRIGGYGCVTTDARGTVSKVYVFGDATVSDAPPRALLPGATTDTPNAIELAAAPSFLCDGDSGGPAFFYPNESDHITRRVIGVNMHTVIESRTSFLASLSTPSAVSFLTAWSDKRGLQICGLHSSTPNCRP